MNLPRRQRTLATLGCLKLAKLCLKLAKL